MLFRSHYDPNALDYSKDIQRIKAKNPDAIVLIGFLESAHILSGMTKEGLGPRNKKVYGDNMTNTLAGQVSPRDPGALAGMKGALTDAGGEAFVKRLREANPGLRDLTYAAQAYDTVVITALAAAVAGTDAPTAVAKQIAYDGPSGPLRLTDHGEPNSATYVINEIQADGTLKPLRSERVSSS